jgi:hypothetical protein
MIHEYLSPNPVGPVVPVYPVKPVVPVLLTARISTPLFIVQIFVYIPLFALLSQVVFADEPVLELALAFAYTYFFINVYSLDDMAYISIYIFNLFLNNLFVIITIYLFIKNKINLFDCRVILIYRSY